MQQMKGFIAFTPEGLEKIKEQKAVLIAKRPEAVQSLRTAREMGDLSENAAYKIARGELSSIDSRLRHLNHLIRSARITDKPEAGIVGIGSSVKLFDGKKNFNYKIVGSFESDPAKSRISHVSPIGKSIMGKRKGDLANVSTPQGSSTFKIISVE